MRVCIVYDCLYPHTVGGAERWYRNLAERLAADGHEITYLTLRQWERGERADIDPRVEVVTAGPRMALYTSTGRRRTIPPLIFGAGVLWHLLRRGGRYDVVHTASFPYFSLLAAALVRPLRRYRIVADWHEVWSRGYWRDYLGGIGGAVGFAVQRMCARVRQRAFCFSRLHAARLRDEGFRGELTVLEGEYSGPLEPAPVRTADPIVVCAGRMIPEKRVPDAVAGVARAAERIPDLEGLFLGDGPERGAVQAEIERLSPDGRLRAPGFVDEREMEHSLSHALCMLLASRREGYGMVVVEAASQGTPSIVVAAEDNAATELVDPGVNGLIAASAEPDAIADAILAVHEAGLAMRESTAAWFAEHAQRLSLESSLSTVLASYDGAAAPASARS